MTTPDIRIDAIDGFAPTQGHGTVDGLPWYYRSRGDSWTLRVAEISDADPVDVGRVDGVGGWWWEGTDEFGGGVPPGLVARLVRDLLSAPRETWPRVERDRVPIRISTPWEWERVWGQNAAEAIVAARSGDDEFFARVTHADEGGGDTG